MAAAITTLTIVQDSEWNECLYVEDKRFSEVNQTCVYASEIAEAAEGHAVWIHVLRFPDGLINGWPDTLSELRELNLE